MKWILFAMFGMSLLLPAAALSAPLRTLDHASIRSFIAKQERVWNARDFRRFYAVFAPNAVIVLVTTHGRQEVARRIRTPAEDRRASEHFFANAHGRIHETDRVEEITIASDRRSARVRVKEVAQILRHGRKKVIGATTEQDLELQEGRIVVLRLMEFEAE